MDILECTIINRFSTFFRATNPGTRLFATVGSRDKRSFEEAGVGNSVLTPAPTPVVQPAGALTAVLTCYFQPSYC